MPCQATTALLRSHLSHKQHAKTACYPVSRALWWLADHMAAGDVNRSDERRVMVGFRMSPADRVELRRLAREAGLSVQAYLESKAFGREVHERPPGRPKHTQEGLPLTG
ncbi:plasmid mobilization protein [Luteipulveratus flavus]|uniref:plasmid mobilization protein n=1 Tax=Luteipulveratus flavus TaxID=3031728 RepID=UPI003907F952